MSVSPSAQSNTSQNATQSSDKTLLKRLRLRRAALLQRNDRWHVLSPDGEGQRLLPAKSNAAIAALLTAGALVAGEDGLLRPHGESLAAVRNLHESPLLRLLKISSNSTDVMFEPDQLQAGERLRSDFEKAHLAPRVVANYTPAEGTGSRHWQMSDNAVERLTDTALAARHRVHDALETVGPELAGLLLQVCCLTCGLEETERLLSLPKRSARAVLLLGLTRLARHYGLKPKLRHAGPSRIGHWAAADYRPVIAP